MFLRQIGADVCRSRGRDSATNVRALELAQVCAQDECFLNVAEIFKKCYEIRHLNDRHS